MQRLRVTPERLALRVGPACPAVEGFEGMTPQLEIVEVGPRDGLQAEPLVQSVAARVDLAMRLVEAGARRIEVASFVNPDRVPQMAGAEEVVGQLRDRVPDGVRLIGLVLNLRGLERALEVGVDEVNTVVAATSGFSEANQGRPLDAVLDESERIGDRASAAGVPVTVTVSSSFGCPYEGEVPTENLVRVVERVVDSEPAELALADTIGVAVPVDVRERFGAVLPLLHERGVQPRCHFHDTRNTALANVWTAAELGVDVADASIGGIGGCPFAPGATGNVATEDVVYLAERSGLGTTFDLDELLSLVPWVEQLVGHPASGSVSRAGSFPRRRD
jgi:hydroxymethylglutaryl-CoA lyase